MTTLENQSNDPAIAGALRGALTIVVIGAALGIGYNAMGLASRPHRGLAWVKQPEKLQSLEALQSAPGATAPASESASHGDAGSAATASAPGDAQAATATSTTPAPEAPKSAPAAEAKHDTSAAAHGSATTKKTGASTKSSTSKSKKTAAHPSTTAPAAAAGSQTSVPAAAAGAAASAPASAGAATSGAATAGAASAGAAATTGGAAATAAADVPAIPDVTGPLKLELATLKKLYAANAALIIDAREAEEYTDGHIKGATSLPYNDAMADPDKVKKLDPAGRPIVVYCSGGDCELSMNLAKLMVENGKRKVLVYEGGFPEWQGAGMPVAKGANP